jgi:hypothetical protein
MEVTYVDLVGEGYMGSMQWQLGRELGTIPAFASRTQENQENLCRETTVITYQSIRRYIPDDLYLQLLCEDIRSFSSLLIVFTSHFFPMPSEWHPWMFDWVIFNLHHTRLIYPAIMNVRNAHIACYSAVTTWEKNK